MGYIRSRIFLMARLASGFLYWIFVGCCSSGCFYRYDYQKSDLFSGSTTNILIVIARWLFGGFGITILIAMRGRGKNSRFSWTQLFTRVVFTLAWEWMVCYSVILILNLRWRVNGVRGDIGRRCGRKDDVLGGRVR